MSDIVIETKKLTKIYGEQTAVSSVDIHVKPGRIYGLLGRNGAGKTTIMKMILGLTPITSGEVDVADLSQGQVLIVAHIEALFLLRRQHPAVIIV